MSDPYLYPGTTVLINHFNISYRADLDSKVRRDADRRMMYCGSKADWPVLAMKLTRRTLACFGSTVAHALCGLST